jgi:hypothetical protein
LRGEIPRTLLVEPGGKTTVMLGIADIAAVTCWLDSMTPHR